MNKPIRQYIRHNLTRSLVALAAIVSATSVWSYNINISIPDCFFLNGQYSCFGSSLSGSINTNREQYGYEYEVRTGDINYDGRRDIFLSRANGSGFNGVVYKTILYQQSNGNFATLPASSYQLSLASS